MPTFDGLPADFFAFLEELASNNRRDWFQQHKPRYLESVVTPIGHFITAIAPGLHGISEHYVADPRPHGGSMFRIYRDTRFSKDKSPFKTHVACHFRHRAGRDAHAPGFYAHFEPKGLYFGGGIWRPPSGHLARIREAICDNPSEWARLKAAKAVRDRGGIGGDGLKRPPAGFDADHQHIEDLKRKSFFVMTEAPAELARDESLVTETLKAFRAAARLNRFITHALELPF
jgi:uncharacterized protein (TIGR02453 family)